jgi:hypothetical protein
MIPNPKNLSSTKKSPFGKRVPSVARWGIYLVSVFFLLTFYFLLSTFHSREARAATIGVSPTITATSSCSSGLSCGLVGYWTFDGKDTVWTSATAATTLDKSGSGNTGTLTNMNIATAPVAGKIGQGLRFDGVSGYVSIAATHTLSNAFTVSQWIKLNTISSAYTYIFWGGSSSALEIVPNTVSSLTIRGDNSVSTTTTLTSSLSAGKWILLTISRDSTNNLRVFFNGIDVTSGTYSNSAPFTFTRIGYRGDNWGPFYGLMDDVRIYNRALSASEVLQLYNMGSTKYAVSPSAPSIASTTCSSGLTCGLVGYWTFDGKDTVWTSATAATTKDKSGSGNTGTLTNMNIATAPVAGKVGQGLYFNGTTTSPFGYVSLATSSISSFVSSSSGCVWFITSNTAYKSGGGAESIFSQYLDSNNNFNAYITSSGLAFFYKEGGTSVGYYSQNTVSNNKWTHGCYTWNGTTFSLYVNGALKTNSGSASNNAGGNKIGTRNSGSGGDGFWLGSLDDVRIYNRALSAREVLQLYDMGSTKYAVSPTITATSSCTSGLSCGLVGYWTFDGKDTVWTSATAATTKDKSGNNNTGTLTNMNIKTAPVAGKIGQGLKFDGSTSYVSVSNTISSRSVAFWIKSASSSASMINLTSGAYIAASSGTITATGFTSPTIYVNGASGSTLTANVWNHIVVTDTAATSSNAITFGKANGAYTTGIIDDVRIYNRALSASEVLQLYNMGK